MITKQSPAAKFHGRLASPCRRCGCSEHWLNALGGIVCLACSPPADVSGVALLACVDGRWVVEGVGGLDDVGGPAGVAGVGPGVPVGDSLAKPASGSVVMSGDREAIADPFAALVKSYRWELDWSVNDAKVERAALAFTADAESAGWHQPVMTDPAFRLLCGVM